MRKRKSPIALATVLALVVCGVVGFQFASNRPGGNPDEAPPTPQVEDTKPVGDARPSASPAQVGTNIKAQMNSGGAKATPTAPEGDPHMPGGGSLVLNPAASAKPEKPKPNPSATSAQWYDKDSAMANSKG